MAKVFSVFLRLAALGAALSSGLLSAAGDETPGAVARLKAGARINCPGEYPGHLQGMATDGNSIYWSFSNHVVRTDLKGKLLAKREVPSHSGDPCWENGRLYVPIGEYFNAETPKGKTANNRVLVFDSDLKQVKKYRLPGFKYGAGGMAAYKGRFFVVGGRPEKMPGNTVYEYSPAFRLIRRHQLKFDSHIGIQTINRAFGRWYFGCYGIGNFAVVADDRFNITGRVRPQLSVGMIPLAEKDLVLIGMVKWNKDSRHSSACAVAMRLTPDAAAPKTP